MCFGGEWIQYSEQKTAKQQNSEITKLEKNKIATITKQQALQNSKLYEINGEVKTHSFKLL